LNSYLENTFNVTASDTDFNDRLKISSIFNYMQNIASVHADNLSLGYKDMAQKKLFWVLSWVKVEVISYPRFNELVKIRTWPKERYKFYFMRDFLLYNKSGEIICKASTAWIVLNTITKRPADQHLLNFDIPFLSDEYALNEYPEKLNFDLSLPAEVTMRKIKYSDIDINLHTNNARYVEFIMDCFDGKFYSKQKVKSVKIKFLYESKLGDEIELKLFKENNTSFIEALNLGNSKKILEASIEWGKI
jgi:acyl-ACP thioesterase